MAVDCGSRAGRLSDSERPLEDAGGLDAELGAIARFYQGDRLDEAFEYCINLIQRHPDSSILHRYLARIHLAKKQLTAAFIAISKAMNLDSESQGNKELYEAIRQ